MKKIITYILFSLSFVFLCWSEVLADIIPENSHPLDLCVEVVNLDQFPDINLIGYITGPMPMVEGSETYSVENGECLTKGYKFNSLSIYNGSVEPSNLLLEGVEVYGGYVDENDPLIKKRIEYSLVELDGVGMVLHKFKITSSYNDGSEDKFELFQAPMITNPLNSPVLLPDQIEERSFWKSILCFFSGIFGKGCK